MKNEKKPADEGGREKALIAAGLTALKTVLLRIYHDHMVKHLIRIYQLLRNLEGSRT